jgi:hypothetical protein
LSLVSAGVDLCTFAPVFTVQAKFEKLYHLSNDFQSLTEVSNLDAYFTFGENFREVSFLASMTKPSFQA